MYIDVLIGLNCLAHAACYRDLHQVYLHKSHKLNIGDDDLMFKTCNFWWSYLQYRMYSFDNKSNQSKLNFQFLHFKWWNKY